jgi:hypothetical protein
MAKSFPFRLTAAAAATRIGEIATLGGLHAVVTPAVVVTGWRPARRTW